MAIKQQDHLSDNIWSKIAPTRSQQVTSPFQLQWSTMLDAARVGHDTEFLDIGCGNGGACELAQQLGAHVTGVDGSAQMLRLASERVPRGDFHHADMERLPFADAYFDAVIASHSIHFATTSVLGALTEVRRVCSPTGRFVVLSPANLDEFAMYEVFAAAYSIVWPHRPVDLLRVSGPGVLENLLEDAGFSLISKQKLFTSYVFEDLSSAWEFIRTLGSIAAVVDVVGNGPVRAAVMRVLHKHERAHGKVRLDGWLPFFVARPKT